MNLSNNVFGPLLGSKVWRDRLNVGYGGPTVREGLCESPPLRAGHGERRCNLLIDLEST